VTKGSAPNREASLRNLIMIPQKRREVAFCEVGICAEAILAKNVEY
jgi:hypothetical protein